MRRLALFGIALGALLVLTPSQEVEARRSGGKARFRIMTFNVRYDFENDGANRWANRVDLVAQTIQDAEAQVVCIQEDKEDQVADLQSRLKGYAFTGRGRNATGSGEHCSILYDERALRLEDSGDFWLSDTPDVPGSNTWGDRYPRKVTWALLEPKKDKKKSLLVLNTHFPEGRVEHLRQKGAQVMRTWLETRLGDRLDKVAIVMCGDYNDGEGSTPYQVLTGGGFARDAWLEARPQDPSPGTFNGFRGMRTQERIDWILLAGPVRALQTAKLDVNYEGRYPSDHYPVIADVELR